MDISALYQEYLDSSGVCMDTRVIIKDQIFFALPGTQVDGGAYAAQAIQLGAKVALVEDLKFEDLKNRIFYVPSVLKCLQALATWHRKQLQIPILGITGSVAKTTTKELIQAVLQSTYKVKATSGNLNNHIGVPLSILSIRKDTEIAIIEMGANHIGEIEELCQIAQPTHGLITRIGKAHLEGFGSLEGVIIAKSDLYRFLARHQGMAFINDQDELLIHVSKGFKMIKKYYADFVTTDLLSSDPYLKLRFKFKNASIEVQTQMPGLYNVSNFSAAAAIGAYFDVSVQNIQSTLQSYQSTSNRSQWLPIDSNEFIMDAYNANPLSMSEAILSFSTLPTRNKKVLILGEMKELGDTSAAEHQNIHALLSRFDWNIVCLVGSAFKKSREPKSNYFYFDDVHELKRWYDQQYFDHTTFLIKASRSMYLEKLFDQANSGSAH